MQRTNNFKPVALSNEMSSLLTQGLGRAWFSARRSSSLTSFKQNKVCIFIYIYLIIFVIIIYLL